MPGIEYTVLENNKELENISLYLCEINSVSQLSIIKKAIYV